MSFRIKQYPSSDEKIKTAHLRCWWKIKHDKTEDQTLYQHGLKVRKLNKICKTYKKCINLLFLRFCNRNPLQDELSEVDFPFLRRIVEEKRVSEGN